MNPTAVDEDVAEILAEGWLTPAPIFALRNEQEFVS